MVAVPPVNQVPVKVPGGADAAPLRLLINLLPSVMSPVALSTELFATPA